MPKLLPRAELRKDYIQDKYVIIAPQRSLRPHAFMPSPADSCPIIRPEESIFSPHHINKERPLDYVGTRRRWQIYVVANKFPAVSLDNAKAYGTQEIVIETPSPNIHLEDLSLSHIANILFIYARRTVAISRNRRIKYLLIFKNAGGRAGASLCHAHSQIFATEFVPPHVLDKSQKTQAYRLTHGHCAYCDVIKRERRGPRLVWEDRWVVAFTPYASVHNYEIWILPKRHRDNISLLSAVERRSWAKILKHILAKINHELLLPYNYYFHQMIADEDQHLYMKIIPRGTVWAGVEIGSGIIINPVTPEDAATFYRASLQRR